MALLWREKKRETYMGQVHLVWRMKESRVEAPWERMKSVAAVVCKNSWSPSVSLSVCRDFCHWPILKLPSKLKVNLSTKNVYISCEITRGLYACVRDGLFGILKPDK